MKRLSLLLLLLLAGAFAWYRWGEREAPAGQAPLATLGTGSLEALRADFNAHSDKVRIVLLLSPT